MSGQSVMDRMMAAKHSIAGQGLAKSVCKATTEEVMGPKKKHLDYLIQCTNEPNVSIPQLANLLIERTQHGNWVVTYKALVTIHNIMNYGNERFTQYLASNNCTFNLSGFLDKTGVQGYDMSTYIRRYSKYLNEKAFSYRQMAFDFCKVKRGKEDGLLRTMAGEKLIKTLPVLQAQVDALLDFEVSPNELSNGVINAAFMLLFKDLIRLFACYNDGIINLLEKYFEMGKKQCREALEQYKKFLVRMQRVSEFLKVAENVGIDRGDIPDLAKAPSSLLEALEEHLKSLESKKGAHTVKVEKPAGVTATINSFAAASQSTAIVSNVSDEERRKILEEEQKQLDKMKKEQQLKAGSPTSQSSGVAAASNPFGASPQTNSPSQNMDLFGDGPVAPAPGYASDDLLGLSTAGGAPNPFAQNNPFAATAAPPPAAAPAPMSSPWGAPGAQQQHNSHGGKFVNEDQFAAVFGGQDSTTTTTSEGFDGFGEILRPQGQPGATNKQPPVQPLVGSAAKPEEKKLIGSDLDTSIATLAGNLSINGAGFQSKKGDLQWTQQPGDRRMTGGMNWQAPVASSTTFGGAPPMGQPMTAPAANMGMMPQQGFQQPPMGYQQMGQPMGMQQPGMGFPQQPGMQQQSAMYGQPRPPAQQQPQPNDPFGAL